MAKLGTYYGLCPLIDHRSLLGVTEDNNNGQVIVTLGKNIAIGFKLSDQKQLNSWRTKDKFTSPVVYDQDTSKYYAVFCHTYIRCWDSSLEHLDKLKKLKFIKPINTLVCCNNVTFVIFQNGTTVSLKSALEDRKTLNPEEIINLNTDYISDVTCTYVNDNIYIGLMINSNNDEPYFIWNIFRGCELQDVSKINLTNADLKYSLIGQVAFCDENKSVQLLTLWSDGKLYSYPIQDYHTDEEIQPPGQAIAGIDNFSYEFPVTMTALSNNYVAMYGADSNQEGAVLIIYNIQFKVVQCKQVFKLFSSGAKLWEIYSNLLLSVGQNLAVVPFHLDTEQLSSLVGSHSSDLLDPDPEITFVHNVEVAEWKKEYSTMQHKFIPFCIRSDIEELLKQGWAEVMICSYILSKYIENKNIDCISYCLKYFNDIPEVEIAKLIQFCLSVNMFSFLNLSKESTFSSPVLQSRERCTLLENILSAPFSDVLLFPHICNTLGMEESLLLLEYICYLMSDDGHNLPSKSNTETIKILIKWGNIVLDANYQKFILLRNDEILTLLSRFNGLVKRHLSNLNDYNRLLSLLKMVAKGKNISAFNNFSPNLKYSVEQINLY